MTTSISLDPLLSASSCSHKFSLAGITDWRGWLKLSLVYLERTPSSGNPPPRCALFEIFFVAWQLGLSYGRWSTTRRSSTTAYTTLQLKIVRLRGWRRCKRRCILATLSVSLCEPLQTSIASFGNWFLRNPQRVGGYNPSILNMHTIGRGKYLWSSIFRLSCNIRVAISGVIHSYTILRRPSHLYRSLRAPLWSRCFWVILDVLVKIRSIVHSSSILFHFPELFLSLRAPHFNILIDIWFKDAIFPTDRSSNVKMIHCKKRGFPIIFYCPLQILN